MRHPPGHGAGSYSGNMYRATSSAGVWVRRAARALLLVGSGVTFLGLMGSALADGATDLEQISPLVWTMIAISVGGSILVFAILAYALWKFRDPETKGRRYG